MGKFLPRLQISGSSPGKWESSECCFPRVVGSEQCLARDSQAWVWVVPVTVWQTPVCPGPGQSRKAFKMHGWPNSHSLRAVPGMPGLPASPSKPRCGALPIHFHKGDLGTPQELGIPQGKISTPPTTKKRSLLFVCFFYLKA